MIRKHSPPHSVQEMKFFITTVRIIKTPHNVTENERRIVTKNVSRIL